ncbi:MAG: hypothetical protein ACPGU5_07085 [Lishizhenia sp.]
MRLGQLARRLEINAKDIVTYLEKEHQISITNHPNSKLPEDSLDAILENFKPSPVEEMNKALEIEPIEDISRPVEPEQVANEVEIEIEEPETHVAAAEVEPTNEPTEVKEKIEADDEPVIEEEESAPLNIIDGIIKAPKVDLEGIKVVGKIDLPEPKKVEEVTESEAEPSTIGAATDAPIQKAPEEKPAKKEKKKPSKSNTRKRPTAQELEERRKAREEKQRLEEIKKKKEKKKAYYQQQVLGQKSTKPKTKSTNKTANKTKKKTAPKEKRPTSLWGKFIFWLNDK